MNSPVPRDLELVARQVTTSPFLAPRYASACSGTVRYSSACSCIGVLQKFTTVAAPTTVVTVTNTISVRLSQILLSFYTFGSLLMMSCVQTTPTATAQVYTTTTINGTTTSTATSISYASTTTTDVIASVVTLSAVPTSFWRVAHGDGVDGQYVVTTGQPDEIIDTFSSARPHSFSSSVAISFRVYTKQIPTTPTLAQSSSTPRVALLMLYI